MNDIKNTLLLINGNIDNSSDFNSRQVGDQSGNFWIIPNSDVKYSTDILNNDTSDFHKSILFNENSECGMVDGNHLFNFSDREFSIDTWIKFDKNSSNLSKKHNIVSKWDNTGSVTDDKVFRFYYKQDINENKGLYYEDVQISFTSTEVLINNKTSDEFEFVSGRAYKLIFSSDYDTNTIGIPETVDFYSALNSKFVPEIKGIDPDETDYREIENLEDMVIQMTGDTNDVKFDNFPDDIISDETEEDQESYLKRRYGYLYKNIVEIEGGILLNLLDINDEYEDIEIEIRNLSLIGDENSYEEESDTTEDIPSSIILNKKILYNRNTTRPTGKLVFEYNGIRGYGSEYRKIRIEDDFVFRDVTYEASEDNTFLPIKFEDIKLKEDQLEKMNPSIREKLKDSQSKVWINRNGILIYPLFKDYEEFYTSRGNLNVDNEQSSGINEFKYQEYLNSVVNQEFLFVPIQSRDQTTKEITFSEYKNILPVEFNESYDDFLKIIVDKTFVIDNKLDITFDFSYQDQKDIVISFFAKEDETYTWKENIRLTEEQLLNTFNSVDEFLHDISDEMIEQNEVFGDDDIDQNNEANLNDISTTNPIRSGRYSLSHTVKEYSLGKIVIFSTLPSENWNSRTVSSEYIIPSSHEYPIDAFNVSNYVTSGMKYEFVTENLIDDEWHHLYFGRVGLTTTDEESGNERIVFGVDGNFKDLNISYLDNEDIPYMEFKNSDSKRVVKLTSIQPFYEAITGKSPYEKLLKQSLVKVGSDNQHKDGNLLGKIDSLRVNEFLTFKTADELIEYTESLEQPECWMYISDSNNYSVYDENTKYNLSGRSGTFGIDLIDVIRYKDNPTNKFEALKHEMGSIPYIKKFVEPEFETLTEDEQTLVINTWRWRLKFIIPVNEAIKTKKELESQLEYANEYLDKEILNG